MERLSRRPYSIPSRRRWLILVAGLSLVAAACTASSESGAGGGEVSTTLPSVPTTTAGTASSNSSDVGVDELCSESLTIPGLDLGSASQIPTFEGDPLDEPTARALVDDLIDPRLTFCGLDVSPQAEALIEAADAAFAAGDADEARRLLESLLDDVEAWGPALYEGILAAGETADTQRVRDLFNAAGAAYRQGNDELGDDLADKARELAIDVATTAAQRSNEPQVLLTAAAQASLLGADDVAQTAIDKALAIVTTDLEALTNGDPNLGTPPFDPCTATAEQAEEYTDAAGRVVILGGDDADAARDALEIVRTMYDRMHGYQEAADECGNLVFTAIDEVPGWDGLIELELRTCDAETWTGMMTIDVTLSMGGGSGRQTGVADASVVLAAGTTQASNQITLDRTITFEAAGESVVVSNPLDGTITFGVDAPNATAEAVVDFPSSTETVSSGGMSFSMPVAGMQAEFSGSLSHDGDCD